MSALENKIEILVRERIINKSLALIKQFLKNKSLQDLGTAYNWYRRLGEYRKGLRLSQRHLALAQTRKDNSAIRFHTYWTARFYYLLGATQFAKNILINFRAENFEEKIFLAEIYLSNFEYESALALYEEAFSTSVNLQDYKVRLMRIGQADCLAYLGHFEQAKSIIREIQKTSNEPLLMGILHSCLGEYEARAGNFVLAQNHLEEAIPYFPPHDPSIDRAMALKWLGYACYKNGELSRGLLLLQEARGLVLKVGIREEACLDIDRLLHEIKALDTNGLIRLRHFPGLSPDFKKLLPREESSFGIHGQEPILEIDLSTDEYRHQQQWNLGLSQEVRLLGLLKLAGEVGMSLARVLNLLWPEDFRQYSLLEKRLEQIIQRCRSQYGIGIDTCQQKLFLAIADKEKISLIQSSTSQARIYWHHPSPTVQDIQKFYGVSLTTAYRLKKKLEEVS